MFGFYAAHISKAFFPAGNEATGLLLTFTTFWLGALMRPVGAIVLGAYLDHVGRRRGLIVTLAIMAAGTALIAVTPSYASIGLAAPVIVLIGRLLQGFSAGARRLPSTPESRGIRRCFGKTASAHRKARPYIGCAFVIPVDPPH